MCLIFLYVLTVFTLKFFYVLFYTVVFLIQKLAI